MQFSEHHDFLIQELQKTFGTTITYCRKGQVIAGDIPAIPAKSELPIDQTNAKTWMWSNKRNYIVKAESLIPQNALYDEPIIPKVGDLIIEGKTEYEVINDENKQCYRPIDPENQYLRIYVQKLS
ncbi:MAG: hypothetical protein LBI18_08305 [Planctomycetaceae bacterium]|jgi:hypothetical protein|nr:hypothetical protein [Planctomycetaceae bacterium]